MQMNNEGAGTAVPPLKQHVVVYFQQKEATEAEALVFYNHYQKRKWKNGRHKKMANWKVAAWEWLLKSYLHARPNS